VGVRVCEMKVISWNVRGLSGFEKRKEVRALVQEKCMFILCLQETKLQVVNDGICVALWGNQSISYSFRPFVGASGGLLTVWDSSKVEVWSSVSFDHTLIIHESLKSLMRIFICLMYMPLVTLEKGNCYGKR